jgi:PqqD family protein of HPr-rel-A system
VQLDSRPAARTDVAYAELDGEGLAYDQRTGELHYLAPTARLVFRLADGSATVSQLASEIADAYDMPLGEVSTHLESLLADLDEAQLLQSGPPMVEAPVPELDPDLRRVIRREVPRST